MTPRDFQTAVQQTSLERASDERLVVLVRSGAEAAADAIVLRYRAPLVRYAIRFLDTARAEEVVDRALEDGIEAIRQGRGRVQLRASLYRVVHEQALDAGRRREAPGRRRERGADGEQASPILDRLRDRLELLSVRTAAGAAAAVVCATVAGAAAFGPARPDGSDTGTVSAQRAPSKPHPSSDTRKASGQTPARRAPIHRRGQAPRHTAVPPQSEPVRIESKEPPRDRRDRSSKRRKQRPAPQETTGEPEEVIVLGGRQGATSAGDQPKGETPPGPAGTTEPSPGNNP